MKVVRMTREGMPDCVAPSTEAVLGVMKSILVDDLEPSVTIEYEVSEQTGASWRARLLIGRLNDCRDGTPSGWLVDYTFRKSAKILAAAIPERVRFLKRELFGEIEEIRIECVVNEPLVEEAVRWYLKSGTQNPSMVWLDYFDGVRPHWEGNRDILN